MTIITAVQGANSVTKASTPKSIKETKVSTPIISKTTDKKEPIKELSPKQIQAKMDMEKIIADKLGFNAPFSDPYITPIIKNENGKWIVELKKTNKASSWVMDRAAKQYEISHICGQLGVKMADLRDVEYATARRTRRGDATIEVGRSVKFDLDKLGSRKDMPLSKFNYGALVNQSKKTIEILSAK